jgi:hypothetical protein
MARTAVDRVHQRTALTGDEALWYRDHADRPADPAVSCDGFHHRPGLRAVAGQCHDNLAGVQRPGSYQRAVEHQVGRPRKQHLVLAAARLSLGAVDHYDRATM